MYISPSGLFIVTVFFVAENLLLYGMLLIPALLIWRISGRKRLAAGIGIAAVAFVAFGIPSLSHLKAGWQFRQIERNDTSSQIVSRPQQISLVQIYDDVVSFPGAPLVAAPCGIQCQQLLLSKQAATVNVTLLVKGDNSDGYRSSATVNYSLEHNGECFVDALSDNPDGFNMPGLLDATIFAAAQGDCIVAHQDQDLPKAIKIIAGSGQAENGLPIRFAEIRDRGRTLYRETAAFAEVLPSPFFVNLDRVRYVNREFGNWKLMENQGAVISSLLEQKLGFSLEPAERYRHAPFRETVERFLTSSRRDRFPSFVNRYFVGYCDHLQRKSRNDLGTADEQVFTLRRIVSDARVSRYTRDDCLHRATYFFYDRLPQAINYVEKNFVAGPDGATGNGFFKLALDALRYEKNEKLKENAAAYVKLATGPHAEHFFKLWPRLGAIADQDPSAFLLEKAAANNSRSTEAILGLCDADPKWASSFMPRLEQTLQELDIFSASAKGEPKISLIAGVAALTRFGDAAASQRIINRLPETLRDKAQAAIAGIIADTGETRRSSNLSRY